MQKLLQWTHIMRSKKFSMHVKQTVVRFQKQNKSIREIGETLGVAKSTISIILRKKIWMYWRAQQQLKRPKNSWKITAVDKCRILSKKKKHPVKWWTLKEGSMSLSKSTMKKILTEGKYRGLIKMCKPFINFKNRKTRLHFAKENLKSQTSSGPFPNLYQNDGKKKYACEDLEQIWSKAYNIICKTCWRQCDGMNMTLHHFDDVIEDPEWILKYGLNVCPDLA